MVNTKEKKYLIDNSALMLEWNWEKNKVLGHDPQRITCGSSIKVWWKCNECAYEWQATVAHRTDKKKATGCPKCSALIRAQQRVEKLLSKENIELKYPEILEEWDYEKNQDVLPNHITRGAHKKIWWRCAVGHSWQATVGNRLKGHGCPYCSGRFAVKGKTDLLTINPTLAQEWNYGKNGDLRPENVTANAGKKVWWLCSVCGHEWQASISNRNKKRGCPLCVQYRHTSIPEKAILFYLSKHYRNIENNKKFEWLQNMELDIFIPELMLAIEYDGRVWHKSEERDLLKDKLCYENGVDLIRIREQGLKEYVTTAVLFMTKEPSLDLTYLQSTILEILNYIRKNYDKDCVVEVNIQQDYYKILSLVKGVRRNSSLGEKCSELLEEWDYEKNGDLNPFNISVGSRRKVWWICSKGHEWKTTVANRTNISTLNKCPYCQGKKAIKGVNDLVTVNASFLVDWDYEKNKTSPDNYMLHSGQAVWWKCHNCGNEWETTIDSRSKHGCWVCSREKIKQSISKPVENIDMHIVYPSAAQAEKENNLYKHSVSRCCRGERKTAGGYHWKFVDKT